MLNKGIARVDHARKWVVI
ncbi:uncharacterized protein FFB20_15643 [Fusarium fujikuroi]|nr:uncharacterized protein FFE2_04259 [Fusarium fujikuroi]SCN81003.1 uncharacterized protein FFM5_02593 [Fusarium fujikuroi]SCN97337.1 uncharacterized protein FFC1_07845 [Fusarium fujikuroi]SCO19196.1 uncharacterized protein FFB20_15643 [Fusarium fujikuroi]SCO32604.1 uncharacterized protein FFMR_02505 [Fusarium fujikuroi]